MQRTHDQLTAILFCLEIPLAIVLGLQALGVTSYAEWLLLPSIFAAFIIVVGLLLIVAILERRRIAWMPPNFQIFVAIFSMSVWLLVAYMTKSFAVFVGMIPLLGCLPKLVRHKAPAVSEVENIKHE